MIKTCKKKKEKKQCSRFQSWKIYLSIIILEKLSNKKLFILIGDFKISLANEVSYILLTLDILQSSQLVR